MAQGLHSCYSLSSHRFDSRRSEEISFLALLRLINGTWSVDKHVDRLVQDLSFHNKKVVNTHV